MATWAFASDEVDSRRQAGLGHRIRLQPDEWKSGDNGWIIDIAGAPAGLRQTLAWLKTGPFKEKAAKIVVHGAGGRPRLELLDRLPSALVANGAAE
jgi:hemolysin-activating ACP:hemolysin acyltransferase